MSSTCHQPMTFLSTAWSLPVASMSIPPSMASERHPKVKYFDIRRDEFELAVLRHALSADLPVLAICRGHQLLNVALGGTLLQHIEGDGHRAYKEEGMPSRWHNVLLEPGSRIAEIYGVPGWK